MSFGWCRTFCLVWIQRNFVDIICCCFIRTFQYNFLIFSFLCRRLFSVHLSSFFPCSENKFVTYKKQKFVGAILDTKSGGNKSRSSSCYTKGNLLYNKNTLIHCLKAKPLANEILRSKERSVLGGTFAWILKFLALTKTRHLMG